jgi:phosphotransferase system  glucose/maltose/N-acetylglucosamine-specific IIC component
VALALGDSGEFYQPLAIAIIGGTITSTVLTLLVVPTFYDSIEIAHDRMVAKFGRRAKRFTVVPAFVMTFVEAILTLVLVRFVFRMIVKAGRFATRRGRPATA